MDIWTNGKFWAAIVALVVIVIANFIPGFALDQDAVVAAVVIVASYAVGVLRDPGDPSWKGVLKSRKFWAAVVGMILPFLDAFKISLPYGITPDILIELITGICSAIILSFAFNTQPPISPDP